MIGLCGVFGFSCSLFVRSPRRISVVQELSERRVDGILKRCQPPEAEGVGPRKALKRLGLDVMTTVERFQWMEEARLTAILGPLKSSMDSWKSGVRCYWAFMGTTVHCSHWSFCCVACVCFVARCMPSWGEEVFSSTAE